MWLQNRYLRNITYIIIYVTRIMYMYVSDSEFHLPHLLMTRFISLRSHIRHREITVAETFRVHDFMRCFCLLTASSESNHETDTVVRSENAALARRQSHPNFIAIKRVDRASQVSQTDRSCHSYRETAAKTLFPGVLERQAWSVIRGAERIVSTESIRRQKVFSPR